MLTRLVILAVLATSIARADPTLADAMALVRAKRYPEARAALERVVAAEPKNAAAWYQLGIVWEKRSDEEASRHATDCLAKAIELEPNNPTYLAEYGGASMELADRARSISDAMRGRDAMEKAVKLNPDDLDAREGLFQFYLRAPFFVGGSSSKAAAELEEIRQRDPARGIVLAVVTKANAKDYDAAFALCDEVLKKEPNSYAALYQYGRTASLSGRNLPRGLQCLQRALTLDPPGPAAPTHSNVWYRIGDILNQQDRSAEARRAFESALKLDPSNHQASAALQHLPKPP